MKTLGERLRYLMNNQQPKRATQKEIAEVCGVKYQSVQRWLKGITLPDSENLQRLAKHFDVSIDYLLQGKSNDSFQEAEEKINPQNKVLAMRIIEERTRLGYSQQEFADKIQIEMKVLQDYEFAKENIPAIFLSTIALSGVDIQYILTGKKSEPKDKTSIGNTNINTMERNMIQGNVNQVNER